MDSEFYLKQQKLLATNKWYRWFWEFWANQSILLYGLAAIFIIAQNQGWKVVILAVCSGLFARYVVCEIVHPFFKKQHPYQRLKFQPPTFWLFSRTDARPDSFPSEHSVTTVAISAVIFLCFPSWGWPALLLPAVIAVARVIVGFHEISDVVFGYFLGLVSGYFVYLLLFSRLFTP